MAQLDAYKILDTLSSAIVVLDQNLTLCYANSRAEEIFDNSKSWMIGKPFYQLLSTLEYSSIMAELDSFPNDPRAITDHEAQITLHNGKSVIADYSIYPIENTLDSFDILIEIRPLERQVEIAREELSDIKKQASQQFARGMAHEIKNPLGGIRGAAQLLEKEISQPGLKEYTDVIISEVDRLDNLITSMLGPRTKISLKPINILEILEHIRRLISVSENSGIQIKVDYDPSIPELRADRDQLTQVFLNLAQNAVQAVGDAGVITFKTRIGRQMTIGKIKHALVVQIDITDNGRGISAEVNDTIFLPMVTDKPQGTGLGLPIAQEIVSRHGGIIRFESTPSGTTFSTLLPLEISP